MFARFPKVLPTAVIPFVLAGVVVLSKQTDRSARGQDPSQPVQQATYNAIPATVHPLTPVLQWAKQEKDSIEKNVADYAATLVSRERAAGKLSEYESVFIKVRHTPLSIYAYVQTPENHKGDEAVYVEGKNDGHLLAHTTGITGRLVGTVSLDPNGSTAMDGQHHPMNEIGMLQVCRRVIAYCESDMRYMESEVRFVPGVKVNGRVTTCIEVTHPQPRTNFKFHLLRVYVDDQLKVPIRYEQFDWPKQPGGQPELFEEYNFMNLKLNNAFTDADFDTRNPNYAFP